MEEFIKSFYTGLSEQNSEKMISRYHYVVVFEDPTFGVLTGSRATSMWKMLCKNATDFKIAFSNIKANDLNGSAHWEAWYTFSKTRKPVHNKIDATFKFKDGKIIYHIDHFSLHDWASQALGW